MKGNKKKKNNKGGGGGKGDYKERIYFKSRRIKGHMLNIVIVVLGLLH